MIKKINNICGSLLTTTSFIISTWYWILKQDTREMEVSIQPLNDFFWAPQLQNDTSLADYSKNSSETLALAQI